MLLELRSLAVFIIVFFFGRRLWALLSRIRTLPPGPWGLPLLGYLPFLRPEAHVQFAEMAKKYGGIFSLSLGNQFVVILSDYKLIREAFRREDFTGRPDTEFTNILGGYGIINSDGRLWKEQRKFLHDKLRRLGMTYSGQGKHEMEARIMKEVEVFLHTLSKEKSTSTDLNPILCTSISNVICSLVMSVRFQQKDAKFTRFMNLIAEGFRLFGSLNYANFFPIMRYLPGLQEVIKKIAKNRTEMAAFFQETVDDHRATFDSHNMRDLVDNYLMEIEDAKATGRSEELFQGKEHNRQMQQIIGDLFSAGMETIKTTLLWAVLYMLHEPEVASKVQEELDRVVGRKRLPSLEDRPYLPYTEAVILEVLRISSVVPLGTTHSIHQETELGGYTIPENAHVVPLLHAVHMDPNLWEEPKAFRPERFINSEGKVFKPEYFIPFGIGRRMCLGDVLARMELFEFFSSLMHTFHLRKAGEDCELPTLEATTGATLTPLPFEVSLVQRPLQDSIHDFLNSYQGLRPAGSI
ncbi:cytochrome P450 18a1 [Halyomorpha halys]|uniref:cytochrome P450 18a1 n=1 Tax=Halyomorpha halys TaxID=286706 RepID=UPI0006D517CE|nr:cytochrome P450 18a1 [Halyomorpha halys]